MNPLQQRQHGRNMIVLVAAPNPRRFTFNVRIEHSDRFLVRSTYQPFFDSARRLLDLGHDPETILVLKHEGSPTEALKSTIGAAGRLTVKEPDRGRIHFAQWKAFPSSPVTPRVRRTAETRVQHSGGPL